MLFVPIWSQIFFCFRQQLSHSICMMTENIHSFVWLVYVLFPICTLLFRPPVVIAYGIVLKCPWSNRTLPYFTVSLSTWPYLDVPFFVLSYLICGTLMWVIKILCTLPLYPTVPCYTMPNQTISYLPILPYHTILPYPTVPYHNLPYYHTAIPYCTIPYPTILPYPTVPCQIRLYHTIPYNHTFLYHAKPHCTLPYHTKPCYATSYPVVLYQATP
jgi:hypothetical protein